ncbi:MAG: hypothetical protein ACRENP_14290 [Longimicrobiales bacterium]
MRVMYQTILMRASCCVVVIMGALLPVSVSAQWVRHDWVQDTSARPVRYPLARVGKWVTLSATTASATYGVLANRDADRRYAQIERICRDRVERCVRASNGAFADAELERDYQSVLRLDDRARWALIASQVSLVATVALFVLDLPRGRSGEDIPYSPPRLRLGADARARLVISYHLSR